MDELFFLACTRLPLPGSKAERRKEAGRVNLFGVLMLQRKNNIKKAILVHAIFHLSKKLKLFLASIEFQKIIQLCYLRLYLDMGTFFGSFYVSVKLPTYPSPKPTFCPK